MSEPILSLEGACYHYEGQAPALREATLSLQKGERVVLLGCNGAGKSTLFLLCNGVLTPDAGEIRLDGKPVGRKDKDLRALRQAVGLVFQDPDDQLLGATVESDISFGPLNLGLSAEDTLAAVEEAMEAMDLTQLRSRPPQYLSGGEKKRVSIADILAMRARILLLDEPTASLDPAHTARLEQTLLQLHEKGLTLVVSTHDAAFAWRWADRALVLAGGEILADGPVWQIFADDDLLCRAGLQKPELYRMAELLLPRLARAQYPRSVEQLQLLLQEKHHG